MCMIDVVTRCNLPPQLLSAGYRAYTLHPKSNTQAAVVLTILIRVCHVVLNEVRRKVLTKKAKDYYIL